MTFLTIENKKMYIFYIYLTNTYYVKIKDNHDQNE